MKKHRKSVLALSLAVVMLTSCGNHFDAPELMEPKAVKDSYCTVTRGNVGDITVGQGIVTAKPYCHFWKTMVEIEEIKVQIGQHVKKGDVLAVADKEAAQETNNAIQKEMNLIQSVKARQDRKYEVQEEEYQYVIKGAKKIGDTAQEKEAKQNLKELEECRKYDNALYGIRMSAKSKELAEIQKIMANTNLEAEHDGYVTYIKDVAVNNIATRDDNVVVISDYNDTYIQMTDTVAAGAKAFEHVFVYDNGKRCDLKELEYSENELMILGNKQLKYSKRYVYADGRKLPEIGKELVIVQKHKSAENVIAVNKQFIYQDEQGSFVYVKNDDGSEKRYIEIGVIDSNMREIVSGLKEGEKIFSTSNATMPSNYTEAKAERKDVKVTQLNDKIMIDNRSAIAQKFYGQGIIEKIVADGAHVKKGDVICQIATTDGAALLNEMQMNISNVREGYAESCDQIDEGIKGLKGLLVDAKARRKKENSSKKDSGKKKKDSATTESKPSDTTETPTTEATATETVTTENAVTEASTTEVPTTEVPTTEVKNEESTLNSETENVDASGAEFVKNDNQAVEDETTKVTTPEIAPPTETDTITENNGGDSNSAAGGQEATTETEKKETDKKVLNNNEKEKPHNPYEVEILECQIEELELDKQMMGLEFDYNISNMEAEYAKQTKTNNGSGIKQFIAEEDCVIRKTYHSKGDEVGYGERLYSITTEGNPKLLIKDKTLLPLNREMDVIVDGKVKYTGKIISDNGAWGQYVTTRDGEVFITYNSQDANETHYLGCEDNDLYVDPVKKAVKCVTNDYSNVVVLPDRTVEEYTAGGNQAPYNFVWKKENDEWNMQKVESIYVNCDDVGFFIIVDGLKENDIVAVRE